MLKSLKLLGMSVVAVAALAAWLGAGSASATVLCKNSTSPCTSKYGSGTSYTATLSSGTELTFAMGFSTAKCTGSSVGFEQTGNGGLGVTVPLKVTALSYSGCNGSVNVTALGSGNVAWTSGSTGSITGSGTDIEIVLGMTCFYGGSITAGLTANGSATATITGVNVAMERQAGSSALCANPAKWSAKYALTAAGSGLWVASS
jgi:hypothetical protein